MKKIITILMVLAISMSLNAASKSKSVKEKLAKEIKKELEPRVEKSSGNYVEGTENTVKDHIFKLVEPLSMEGSGMEEELRVERYLILHK